MLAPLQLDFGIARLGRNEGTELADIAIIDLGIGKGLIFGLAQPAVRHAEGELLAPAKQLDASRRIAVDQILPVPRGIDAAASGHAQPGIRVGRAGCVEAARENRDRYR